MGTAMLIPGLGQGIGGFVETPASHYELPILACRPPQGFRARHATIQLTIVSWIVAVGEGSRPARFRLRVHVRAATGWKGHTPVHSSGGVIWRPNP